MIHKTDHAEETGMVPTPITETGGTPDDGVGDGGEVGDAGSVTEPVSDGGSTVKVALESWLDASEGEMV